ncbi:hypothetical protein BgiBS90_026254, partial [Biomphalaria glabrata]
MWKQFNGVAVEAVTIGFTLVLGSSFFPQNCLEDFEKFSTQSMLLCIHGDKRDNPMYDIQGGCTLHDYLLITDFYLYIPCTQLKVCDTLAGFNYKSTIKASCLQRTDPGLTKKLFLVLIQNFSVHRHQNVSYSDVQSSLNAVMPSTSLLAISYECVPKARHSYLDMCSEANLDGLRKSIIALNTSELMSSRSQPSSCTCSVMSLDNSIRVHPIDVRLTSRITLQVYQENNDVGLDLFKSDSLIWMLAGHKEFFVYSINIILTFKERWQLSNSLWIEIAGEDMNISCSPEF